MKFTVEDGICGKHVTLTLTRVRHVCPITRSTEFTHDQLEGFVMPCHWKVGEVFYSGACQGTFFVTDVLNGVGEIKSSGPFHIGEVSPVGEELSDEPIVIG